MVEYKSDLGGLLGQLMEGDPKLRAKLNRAEAWRGKIADDIKDELRGGTSFGGVAFGLLHNLIALTYLNEGMNRGRARDKLAYLIDEGFDAVEEGLAANGEIGRELKTKTAKLDAGDPNVSLLDVLDIEQVKLLLRRKAAK